MDERDRKYYSEYSKLINKHSKTQCLVELDLTKDYHPPKDLYLEVRALEDIKDITIKNGNSISVTRNNTYLLKRSDIDIYIRRGLFSINE